MWFRGRASVARAVCRKLGYLMVVTFVTAQTGADKAWMIPVVKGYESWKTLAKDAARKEGAGARMPPYPSIHVRESGSIRFTFRAISFRHIGRGPALNFRSA